MRELLNYIKSNPGRTIAEIAAALKVPELKVRFWLHSLRLRGQVVTERRAPNGHSVPLEFYAVRGRGDQLSADCVKVQRKILAALSCSSMRRAELVSAIGESEGSLCF